MCGEKLKNCGQFAEEKCRIKSEFAVALITINNTNASNTGFRSENKIKMLLSLSIMNNIQWIESSKSSFEYINLIMFSRIT